MLRLTRSLLLAALVLGATGESAAESEDLEAFGPTILRLLDQGRFTDAVPLATRFLEITESLRGPDHRDTALARNNLGFLHLRLGEHTRAIVLYREALRTWERAVGAEDPTAAVLWSNIAATQLALKDLPAARVSCERALAIRRKALGEDDLLIAVSLDQLASVRAHQGDAQGSYALSQEAIRIYSKHVKPVTLEHLASVTAPYERAGGYGRAALAAEGPPELSIAAIGVFDLVRVERFTEADPLLAKLLRLVETWFSTEHGAWAVTAAVFGMTRRELGDYAMAEHLLGRAAELDERALGPKHPFLANTLSELGSLYKELGRYEDAERTHSRALIIREQAFGPDHLQVAVSLDNLATVYQDMGDFGRAEPVLERALAIRESNLGPEHPGLATTLNNLAYQYNLKGDHDRAEALYGRALAIREKALGPSHPDCVYPLSNLAGIYSDRGDYGRALPFALRALAIAEETRGAGHPDVAAALSGLGEVYQGMGRSELAEQLYVRALSVREGALGPDHPYVAASLGDLAHLRETQADYGRANALYERALRVVERALGSDHPDMISYLSPWARLHWGHLLSTRDALGKIAKIEERQISLVLPAGSEHQALAYMDRVVSFDTTVLLSFVRRNPRDEETVRLGLAATLQRKGRVLDLISDSYAAIRRRGDPESLAILDELARSRGDLARMVTRGPSHEGFEQHSAEIAGLTARIEEIERRAHRRGGALRRVTTAISVEEVQRRIPARARLVEFVTFTISVPGRDHWQLGEEHVGAFVLGPTGGPTWTDLGPAEKIRQQVSSFRETLARVASPVGFANQLGRQLYDLLIASLEPALEGASHLLISPDGELNLIPYGALVASSGDHLIERYTITYLTSGRDLLRSPGNGEKTGRPMIIASPDYGMKGVREPTSEASRTRNRRSRDVGTDEFEPLPGTLAEARELEALMGVRAVTGRNASEGVLKRVRRPSILHIATHGFFLEDQDVGERPTHRPRIDGSQGASLAPGLPARENPLLRAGLALAGANRLEDGSEDGVLTALEMAGLDLDGTELVVLSACETGVGKIEVGEGVYGLRRAVMIAGAESEVTTLWKVDDNAAKAFMVSYYGKLLAGEGRSEALRRTQLEFLRSKYEGHPYYWASFLPIGEWGPIAKPSRDLP